LPEVADFDVAALMERGDERAARNVLRAIGVPVVGDELATNAAEAAAIAGRMGGRLALKVASPDILHKSDIGGVRLGVTAIDAAEVFDEIMSRARAAHPGARIDGVIISPMIEGGIETIVGVKRDEVFGPIVMFGLGGVLVEVFHDTAVAAAPFGRETALRMIRSVKSYPLLAGVRGRPGGDVDALADALARISVLAHRNAHLVGSIDVNPLLALPKGVVALDALIVPDRHD
jgi:acyl-CoA synthetase (NDP forming)